MSSLQCTSLALEDWLEYNVSQSVEVEDYVSEKPNTNIFAGTCPNTAMFGITELEHERFLPLPPATDSLIEAAQQGDPGAMAAVPQGSALWISLRHAAVTGSALAAYLGFFEAAAGKALSSVGITPAMRDHEKLVKAILNAKGVKQEEVVDPLTAVYFDWGHRHELNGVKSFLNQHTNLRVQQTGFTLLSKEVIHDLGLGHLKLPNIGSSPDGLVFNATSNQMEALEVKTKVPFVPGADGTWRYLGKRCAPYKRLSVAYFCQMQLHMLVTGTKTCHYVCYTPSQTSWKLVAFDRDWCVAMLKIVSRIHQEVPVDNVPNDVLFDDVDYKSFLKRTSAACRLADEVIPLTIPSENGKLSRPLFWDSFVETARAAPFIVHQMDIPMLPAESELERLVQDAMVHHDVDLQSLLDSHAKNRLGSIEPQVAGQVIEALIQHLPGVQNASAYVMRLSQKFTAARMSRAIA